MAKLRVEVIEIKEILEHSNADRLEIAVVKGWECVVQKGVYKKGDDIIYVPIDSVLPVELSDKLGVTNYLSKGRVRTAKLRGVYSQGLIIGLEHLPSNYNGDNVKEVLGITKYLPPPPPAHLSGKQIKQHPDFHRYTDIENIKNFPDVLQEGELVSITEKIHGCFRYDTKITLADGTKETIGKIVNNKISVNILGVNDNGQIISTKILNWFDNGITNIWSNIKFTRKGLSKGNHHGSVYCTPNQEIYFPSRKVYVQTDTLKINDKVLVKRNKLYLSYIHQQILIGKLLGDGSLINNSLVFYHKKQHEHYVDYTLKCLGNIAGNKQKDMTSGFGTIMSKGRSISSPTITNFFKEWYISGKKEIPENIELSPISLAFWYMDDGSLAFHKDQEDRVLLATCGFNENSIDNLLIAFSKLGIMAVKYKSDKKYWRIRLNADHADKFFVLILPYIYKEMQYKLPERYRGLQHIKLSSFSEYKVDMKEQKIIDIEKNIEHSRKYMNKRFDIETETHNFFANDVLVHNSNFRSGKLIGETDFELHVGTHNTNLVENPDNTYWKCANMYKLNEILDHNMVIYGEVYGSGVQKLTYGLKSQDVAFFDLMVNGKYINTDDFKAFCKKHNLPQVPILFEGPWDVALVNLANGSSTIASHIREGIVIKPKIERYNSQVGRVAIKHLSEKYLLKDYGDLK